MLQFLRKMQKQSKNWPGVQYPLKIHLCLSMPIDIGSCASPETSRSRWRYWYVCLVFWVYIQDSNSYQKYHLTSTLVWKPRLFPIIFSPPCPSWLASSIVLLDVCFFFVFGFIFLLLLFLLFGCFWSPFNLLLLQYWVVPGLWADGINK